MFDIDALTNAPVDAPFATTIPVCPIGEYNLLIDSLDSEGLKKWLRTLEGKDGKPSRLILEVPCIVLDENVKAQLGREKVTVRKSIWLDVGSDGRTLLTGEGKNVDLGRLREAVGQNAEPNWTFARLAGAGPFRGTVTHRNSSNGDVFAEVGRVAKL